MSEDMAMARTAHPDGKPHPLPLRAIAWAGAAALLLIPALAGAPWTAVDYGVAALLIGGAGLGVEIAARASGNRAYRVGACAAIAAGVLLFWVNAAVGVLGDEDNPANLMFLAVVAVALVGALTGGFRPFGMARAMLAAAVAQASVGAIAAIGGLGSPGAAGLIEAGLATLVFGGLWLASAAMFRRAALARA